MKKIVAVSVLLAWFFSACKKDRTVEEGPVVVSSFQTNELSIPTDFNFETTESIALDINLEAAPLSGS